MANMKAAQFATYGGPEVLHVSSVGVPEPALGDVLVRVRAAGVNGHDLFSRAGALRLITGRRFPLGTGIEFAGEIMQSRDPRWQPGQPVWGSVPAMKPHSSGSMAEYVAVSGDRIALVPSSLSAVEAASLVVTSTTALRAVESIGRVTRGDSVLIRGAAGGVGRAAVQIAVAAGAEVTTLSSDRDRAFLAELGATTTLDYAHTAPSQLGRFDLVVDTVGTEMLSYRRLVRRGGRMVTIAFTSFGAFAAITCSLMFGSRRIRAFSSDAKSDLLDRAGTLVAAGTLRAHVAGTYPLDRIGDAHRAFAARGTRGKLVIMP